MICSASPLPVLPEFRQRIRDHNYGVACFLNSENLNSLVIIPSMNQLDQIESRIKEIIEKSSGLSSWADQDAILVSHFCESLRRFLLEEPDGMRNSPGILRVFMSSDEVRLWKQQTGWQENLNNALLATVVELNCKPDLLPDVVLISKNSLQSGSIIFTVEKTPNHHERTGAVQLSRPMKVKDSQINSVSGRVLINLEKTYSIEKPVINLGRRGNNDIVINDLRVSRLHAQIRKTHQGYMIFDVDSTGGTFVNGERITSSQLKPGDVISLAGYTLIFTHEKECDCESEAEITSTLSTKQESDKQ